MSLVFVSERVAAIGLLYHCVVGHQGGNIKILTLGERNHQQRPPCSVGSINKIK